MTFSINCSCGRPLAVTASDAGAEVRCVCGAASVVPSLSELRRAAGQPRYNPGALGEIRRQVAAGTLPSDKLCVNCGAATHGVLHCEVECERPWAKGARLGFWRTLSFILHPSLAFHSEWDDGETHGRQTVVEVPLRMCRQCRTAARGWTTNNLIELLHTVRLYDELLREYPEATASLSSRRGEEP